MDRPTDGRTHSLIESWLTTKNIAHKFEELDEQVRIHEISRSPARLCPPTKALPTGRRTNGPTDRRTNGPTDGRTHPLIELWPTTKNFKVA